jgi:hypothetical protein
MLTMQGRAPVQSDEESTDPPALLHEGGHEKAVD